MQFVKSGDVTIPPIHDVNRSGLQYQSVEHIDIAQLAVSTVNEAGSVAVQVQQRVQLNLRLGGAKQSPRKELQAQVGGRRVQRVCRILQLDTKAVAHIELVGLLNQALGEFCLDSPIARFVGIGQRRVLSPLPQVHVIEFDRLRRKTYLDVP